MAQPTYVFSDNFESGDNSGWDSEADTSSQLDFAHYTALARTPGLPMPYSGSNCMRVTMVSGNASDATVTEGDIDIANGQTRWFRFNLWIDPNLTTNDAIDTIPLFETQGAAAVVTFAFGIRYTLATGNVQWALGEATPDQLLTAPLVPLGKWMTVELALLQDTDSADGSITLYVTEDGQEPSSTAVHSTGSIQSIATEQGVLGVQNKATSTTGTILFDNFAMDEARIWPDKDRFKTTMTINESQHVFVGPGTVSGLTLASSGGTDNIIAVYDTDTAQAHQDNKRAVLANVSANEIIDAGNVPFDVIRGCYVEITGTDNPEVTVQIDRAPGWFSDGNMRRYATQRRL
jgi:hypothetical protein